MPSPPVPGPAQPLRSAPPSRGTSPPPTWGLTGAPVTSSRGQASVELVVLLPVIAAVLALAYQAVLAGQAVWEVRVAARAAARAHAFGADAAAAARTHLRAGLEPGLQVRAADDGDVRVSVRVPAVLPAVRLGRVSATSHFQPQGG